MACSISFPTFLGSRNAMETLEKSPDQWLKCSSHLANSSAVIYPDGLGYPTDPGGVPAISDCDIR